MQLPHCASAKKKLDLGREATKTMYFQEENGRALLLLWQRAKIRRAKL